MRASTVGVVRLSYRPSIADQMATARRIGASIVVQSAAPIFFEGPTRGHTTRAAFDAWPPRLGDLSRAARAGGCGSLITTIAGIMRRWTGSRRWS